MMTLSKKILISALPAALLASAASAQQRPTQAAPAQQRPTQAAPDQQRPTQAAPDQQRPAQAANAQQAPAGAANAQKAPAQAGNAQTPISAGAKVKDTKGGEVGTVVRVDGQFLILKTDKHEARLPVTSFTAHEGGFVMAMTRDELNAEIDKTIASAASALVAGAAVSGSQGSPVGKIDTIDDQFVTLVLTSGKKVRLPRSGIAPGPNGAVIGMTATELEEAAAAAGATPK